ncbi:MAG: GIY-YIG nuclease family protein [Zavarzinella sp.]
MKLDNTEVFLGFGPTRLYPSTYQPQLASHLGKKEEDFLPAVRENAPKVPGVYGMFDRTGKLIYVGKSKCLRARLMSYFRKKTRDPKAGRILRHTRRLVWETISDEFGSLARELELIQRHRPRFNVMGVTDRKRYCYIVVTNHAAPTLAVKRAPQGNEKAIYGPFRGAGFAKVVVRTLNHWYHLRDCSATVPTHYAEEPELFPIVRTPHCFRHEIASCLGPCAAECTQAEYASAIKKVRSFLDGRTKAPLDHLQREMARASKLMQFERAAHLRDQMQSFEWLNNRLNWLRDSRRENTFIYPVESATGSTTWYVILRGQIIGTLEAPANRKQLAIAREQIDQSFEIATKLRPAPGETDFVLLVSAWLTKYPAERAKCIPREMLHGKANLK